MEINDTPLSAHSVGALDDLTRLAGWDQWGRQRWIAAALGMAAQAGARLSAHPEAAERLLATLSPEGDQLYTALCLAARCGSIAQMQRFIDLGADPLRAYDDVKKANETARNAAKEVDAIGPYTPVSMPFWEAIEAGRHRAALWLIEKGVQPAQGALPKALLSTLKWQGRGEADADRELLRQWHASRMQEPEREEWSNGACVALANTWEQSHQFGSRRANGSQEELHREQERQLRATKTFLAWTRRALDWGSTLNPTPPDHATPLGLAIYAGSLPVAQELFNLGARIEEARLGSRVSLPGPIAKAGFEPGMALLVAFAQPPILEWAFASGMAPTSDSEWDRVAFVMRDALKQHFSPNQSTRESARVEWLEARIERERLKSVVSAATPTHTEASEPPAPQAGALRL